VKKNEVISYLKKTVPELYNRMRKGIASEEELEELDKIVKRFIAIIREREGK
jgi:hypothetical protein